MAADDDQSLEAATPGHQRGRRAARALGPGRARHRRTPPSFDHPPGSLAGSCREGRADRGRSPGSGVRDMTRNPARPPEHPLVEFGHDLVAALGHVFADDAQSSAPKSYQQVRIALRSVRQLIDALELLVDDLEAQSRVARGGTSARDEGIQSDSYHSIVVTTA